MTAKRMYDIDIHDDDIIDKSKLTILGHVRALDQSDRVTFRWFLLFSLSLMLTFNMAACRQCCAVSW